MSDGASNRNKIKTTKGNPVLVVLFRCAYDDVVRKVQYRLNIHQDCIWGGVNAIGKECPILDSVVESINLDSQRQ